MGLRGAGMGPSFLRGWLQDVAASPCLRAPAPGSSHRCLASSSRVCLASGKDGDNGSSSSGSSKPAAPENDHTPAGTTTTASGGRGRRATRFAAGPKMTLEHFLLRGNIVKLYRAFLRASRNIPNPQARRETVDWLRDEHFEGPEGLRRQTDAVRAAGAGQGITRTRELLVAGNAALKRICGPMELAAALNPEHGSFPKLRGHRAQL